jgi:hypothetical protein
MISGTFLADNVGEKGILDGADLQFGVLRRNL